MGDFYEGIVDLSHHNKQVSSFHQAQAAGIGAVILKVCDGLQETDEMYGPRKMRALSVPLLVGAYHFGRPGNGAAQADRFLTLAGKNVLVALDLEIPSDTGIPMPPAQAEAFVQQVHRSTGIWPVLYLAQNYIHDVLDVQGYNHTSPLAFCPAWIARYGGRGPDCGKVFSTWSLWQYSDGRDLPEIPGLGAPIDRDRLHAGIDRLASFWKEHSV